MITLEDLIKRDNVTAAWFWTSSISAGPYAENESFDVTFVRETDMVVGGGYHARRTFHAGGIQTAQADSRRKHGGKIVRPDMIDVLAHLITDAYYARQYETVADWVSEHRDSSRPYLEALADYEDWQELRALDKQIRAWAGARHIEYVEAAQKYVSEH